MQDAGCKMQDARCKMQEAGGRRQEAGGKRRNEGVALCAIVLYTQSHKNARLYMIHDS